MLPRPVCKPLGLLLAMTWLATQCALVRADEPLALKGGQLYLVFDPRLRGDGDDCELIVHSFKRHPANPVIKPEFPWEGLYHSPRLKPSIQLLGFIQIGGTVLWEPDEEIFRMWYSGSIDVQGYTSQVVRGNHIELPVRWDDGKDWPSL